MFLDVPMCSYMFLYVPICSYMFLDVPYGAMLPPSLMVFLNQYTMSCDVSKIHTFVGSKYTFMKACMCKDSLSHGLNSHIFKNSNIHQRNLKDNLSAFSLPHLVSNIWINMKLVLAPHVPVSLFSCFCPLRETFGCMELHVVGALLTWGSVSFQSKTPQSWVSHSHRI